MKFYHLDRIGTLQNGTLVQSTPTFNALNAYVNANIPKFYPSGISKTGERYLSPFDIDVTDLQHAKDTIFNAQVFMIEYIFETVRKTNFPNCPSRFTSLFACKDLYSIKKWFNILSTNNMDCTNAHVLKIRPKGRIFIADSVWRDESLSINGKSVFSTFAYEEFAINYWSGISTKNPIYEVLCELPVEIIKSIPYDSNLDGLEK